ncbi:MAG TPA: carboxymuconolactone decarboxylase family protein [Vineibacter sp.]|nr:carboxymuconolactone decarboxylase family protein [Vineibacter sp.]
MAEKYRLAPLDMARLTPDQRAVADAIISGPRGGLRGPFEPWLRSPTLADRAQKLGEYCRFGNSLPKDLAELAILMTGKRYRAQYEFWAHARLAREAGLPDDIIEAVRLGKAPKFRRDSERAIYDLVSEYFATNRVSDATFKRAIDALGERGVVDLVGTVGYYSLVSMTLNVFQLPLPAGEKEPLAAPSAPRPAAAKKKSAAGKAPPRKKAAAKKKHR